MTTHVTLRQTISYTVQQRIISICLGPLNKIYVEISEDLWKVRKKYKDKKIGRKS